MEDLKRRFDDLRGQITGAGDIIILWYAVNHMRYSDIIIRRAFNQLVSKDEYEEEDKKELIDYLIKYTNDK